MNPPNPHPETFSFLGKLDSMLITYLLKSITKLREDIERLTIYMVSFEKESYQPTQEEPRDKRVILAKLNLTKQLNFYYQSIRDWDIHQQAELNTKLKSSDHDKIRNAVNYIIWVTDRQIRSVLTLL
jgi:hypothetical protein